MNFEDFNYNSYNKHILINPDVGGYAPENSSSSSENDDSLKTTSDLPIDEFGNIGYPVDN